MNNSKQINVLHLRYLIIIFLIVLLAFVLVCHYAIADEAFKQFSFAATITSIILAVVSIIYTISSGSGMSAHMEAMQNIERDIKEQVNTFSTIDDKIRAALDSTKETICAKVGDVQKDVTTLADAYSSASKKNALSDDSSWNTNLNSPFGNAFLILCKRACAEKKVIRYDIISDDAKTKSYLHGYLVALNTALPKKIEIHPCDEEKLEVRRFDDSYFTNIENYKPAQKVESAYQKMLQSIDAFFKEEKNEVK